MNIRLLLVEDDPRIVSFLRRGLEAEGYAVDVAMHGSQALELARTATFALIILDRMLPGLDGLQVCRTLREEGSQVPILMLTAKDTLEDKIDGLKGGADDYLTKPFAFDEVLARIEALLRRSGNASAPSVLTVGNLRLDFASKAAWRGERQITLTAKEFALLAFLMARAGTVVTREELLKTVWGLKFDPGTNVVDVYIRYLRRKIDGGEDTPMIQTVRGFGYTISGSGADPFT
jgi:two-component system, OmpR family, response regulator